MSEVRARVGRSLAAIGRAWDAVSLGVLVVTLAVTAAASVVLHEVWSVQPEWMPNVATEAVSLLLTIAVVDRVIRRRERRRLAPRVDRALFHMGASFARFMYAVVWDYAATHNASFRPIPADAVEMLDQWLEDQDAADMPRAPFPDPLEDERETLLSYADTFADDVIVNDDRDADVLEPDLVAAIRDFHSSAYFVSRHWRVRIGSPQLAGYEHIISPEREAHRTVVAGARKFAVVLRKYAPPGWFRLDETQRQWAEDYRRQLLDERGL